MAGRLEYIYTLSPEGCGLAAWLAGCTIVTSVHLFSLNEDQSDKVPRSQLKIDTTPTLDS
eukprot:scaffold389620_cov19-Prasinocladus_malaysianus.AAC.1